MESDKILEQFWGYLEFYPGEDEPDFDGIHDGGIKGIRDNAPDEVKKAFTDYQERQKEANENGMKV